MDVLNTVTSSPGRFSLAHQSREERLAAVAAWCAGGQGEGLGGEAASLLSQHFHQERLQFGLYGLYPKYRLYVEPLAALLALLGGQLVASSAPLAATWPHVEALYAPWLFPLPPGERGAAAAWIQQLTDPSSALPPWIPGDAALAAEVLASLLSCLAARLEGEGAPGACAVVWRLYCRQWGVAGSKEHVQGVVHPALATLPWHRFAPDLQEVEMMVRLVSQFSPTTHAFLGTVFLKVEWRSRVEELGEALLPALLTLLVKLSGEPSVRQAGALTALLEEAEGWAWAAITPAHFESVVQWWVMSVDCRVVLRHPDRSPLDEAVIRQVRAAAGFGREAGPAGVAKQQVWVRCAAKLLTTCGSKQRNFLAHNQPALHTSLRRVLEDISAVAASSPTTATMLVKAYLTTLNSPSTSVLPGSALTVLRSWLVAPPVPPLLHALLSQATTVITDPSSAASVVEASLEAAFRDTGEVQVSWALVLPQIAWPPSPPRLQALLAAAVAQGAGLLLHAHIRHRQPVCASVQEERVLAASLLEWVREVAAGGVVGREPKLPVLYRQLVVLLHRQAAHSTDSWVVGALGQLADLLLALADSSPGWGQNLLGAMGGCRAWPS